MKKRAKASSFIRNSKNAVFALLLIAAAITAYSIANAATVSHTPQQIQPQGAKGGFDSATLLGYSAADFLVAAGSEGSGCTGGICSTFPKGYYIGWDWDGDLKTAMTGDCDETCKSCYSGSAARTPTLDGQDQDCDGVIDEPTSSSVNKPCCGTYDEESGCSLTYYVAASETNTACNNWCISQGLSSGKVGGYTSTWSSWGSAKIPVINFRDCTASYVYLSYWSYAPKGVTCYCEPVTGYQ